MSDLSGIIERLERASGPDREIDAAIFAAIGLTSLQERHCIEWCSQNGRTDLTRERYIAAWAPDYSRSIDSALTLVPEGWRFGIEQAGMFDGNDLCEVWVWPFEDSFDPDWQNGDQGYRSCENAKRSAHKLLAIALVIAALRARSHKGEG